MRADSNKFGGFRWPVPLAGIRGIKLADVGREIPAGITLAAKDGDPTLRPYEVAMRMWDMGYYVRYGGDTIQLGLPFVIGDDEITQLISALGKALDA